jgi:hypothetical protein
MLRSHFVQTIYSALLLACFTLGALLSTIVPTQVWANARRAANLAANHHPNMDPQVVVMLAVFVMVPYAVAVVVVEAVRMLRGGPPLLLPSAALLGLLVGSPVGYSLSVSGAPQGWQILSVLIAASVAVFYSIRFVWLRARVPA